MLNQYDLLMRTKYLREGMEDGSSVFFFLNTAKSSTINLLIMSTSRKQSQQSGEEEKCVCTKATKDERDTNASAIVVSSHGGRTEAGTVGGETGMPG